MYRSPKEKIKYNLIYSILKFISRIYFFKPYQNKKDKLSCVPFFILGSGRNGSTLLSSLLNQYRNIHIPPEQFVLPYSIMKYNLLNFLSIDKLYQIISKDFKKNKNTVNWKFYNKSKTIPINSFKSIIDKIYTSSSKDNFLIWGDKTPQNTFFINHIFPVYPNAKYIFIIRDGRDVINSLIKMMRVNKNYKNYSKLKIIKKATLLWNESIESYDYLLKRNANVKLVKYEDFTANPSIIINELITFLEVDKGLIENGNKAKIMGVSKMDHHKNLNNPISTASIGKWKKELDENVLNFILPKILKNLNRFGY